MAHDDEQNIIASTGTAAQLPVPAFAASREVPLSEVALEPLAFTATAGGYFRVWIVNLVLTFVTLGIFSAWAKVRKRKYLFGHTWLAGSNFAYHGNPITILKGRIIAVIVVGVLYLLQHFAHRWMMPFYAVVMLALPWFIVRALRFNAVNTSWRGIHFNHHANYWDAFKVFWPFLLFAALSMLIEWVMPDVYEQRDAGTMRAVIWLMVPSIVLIVLYPLFVTMLKRLQINHLRFGATRFATKLKMSSIYGLHAGGWLLGMLAFALAGVAAGILASRLHGASILLFLAPIYLALVFTLAFVRAVVTNHVVRNTHLSTRARFASKIEPFAMAWIYMSNLVVIALTAGLAIPWAVVRTARYRITHTYAAVQASSIQSLRFGTAGAVGEEVGEFLNVDVSI